MPCPTGFAIRRLLPMLTPWGFCTKNPTVRQFGAKLPSLLRRPDRAPQVAPRRNLLAAQPLAARPSLRLLRR
jgi:hypothetical protein